MGRLSDARKKARKGQPAGLPPAATAPTEPAPEPLLPEPAMFGAPEAPDEAAALADEILGAAAPTDDAGSSSVLPSSGLAEDILREWEAKKKPEKSEKVAENAKIEASGATGKIEELDNMWPDELIGSGNEAASRAVLGASGLAEDLLEVLRSEAPEPVAQPLRRMLPSSGLAEEILQIAERPEVRGSLGLEEIHQFETFFEEERADELLQLVLFEMEGECFALEIDRVQEIIRVPAITRVPHVAKHVRGVCNLRGRIVPVLELRLLMRLQARPVDRDSRIMVIDVAGKQIGVLIDRASEVAHVKVSDVEPPPEEMRSFDRNLVTAVARLGARMIFILDVDRVMSLK